MASDIPAGDTSTDWPGWVWEEWTTYWTDVLPPVVPLPGSLLTPRDRLINNAWSFPRSVAGFYLHGIIRVKEALGDDAVFAARTALDDQNERLDRPALNELLEETMPQLIIPDCFQVSINGVSGSQPVTNVVGVRNAGGTAAGAAGAVRTAWKIANGPLAVMPGYYVLSNFRAMDISSGNGAIAEITDSTAGGLGTTTNLATNAACALVKWNGGTRSGSSRGRLYHGPLRETGVQSDGRTLDPATRTSIEAAYNAFLTSLTNAGYPLVVLSRKNSAATTVTSVGVEGIIATQRRRIR